MAATQPKTEPVFSLEKIYLKDVSFESPGSPGVFLKPEQPDLQMQIGIGHGALDAEQGFYEVVLSITATAKGKENTMFLVEVQQAGIFRILNLPAESLQRTLEISCPYVLLPFAREAVSALVSKGGFPQLLVTPVNFEALYEQKLAAQKQPSAASS